MFAKINSIGLFGMNAFPVTAEIIGGTGIPGFEIVGLADASVQESRQRITGALKTAELHVKPQDITINLTPASVKKAGSSYDLAILTAILAVSDRISADISKSAFIGEVSLGGGVNAVAGALTMAIEAKNSGMDAIFLPLDNAAEAAVIAGLTVYGVSDIINLALHLTGEKQIKPQPPYVPAEAVYENLLDFSDVRGQRSAKHALEIAAAGFHNVLMLGTPGTGKSMLAGRLPSILPAMSFGESVETTQIHSIAGILDKSNPLVVNRPFRPVSHTASAAGLVGGSGIPKPGEISLAHNGVLFLDELPEFDRRTLETLRQPVENREIVISRASGSVRYPCNFMLIAAMNPCPCGNLGHPTKPCSCSDTAITRYLSKISQPVLDRIDIHIEIPPVTYNEISDKHKSESSSAIRERVYKAREIQARRFKGTGIKTNSGITAAMLREVCIMDEAAGELIKNVFDRLGVSARAYDRILKVARTSADLDNCGIIGKKHISEAVSYRSLDRKYWHKGKQGG